MSEDATLILYGVFRQLVHNHVPLGVSDYLDAVRAVEWQLQREEPSRFARRDGLRRLCQVLWARSPDEVRLIDRIFENIPAPTREELDYLLPALDRAAPSTDRRQRAPTEIEQSQQPAIRRRASDASERDEIAGRPQIAVSFESVGGADGVTLPYPVLPAVSEAFVMQPQTIMSPRALAVLWRRYRRMVRTGPRTDVDLDATTAERIRRGVVDRPVLRPRRANTARLLILADASPSMSAWGPFLDTLATSIVLSRLQSARLLFFANVPRQSLFPSATLTNGIPARRIYEQHAGAGMLVISDAGAARGFLNRARVRQTQQFLREANTRTRAIVWVNPMPDSRWTGTTAGAIASEGGATFLPLDSASMLRAVDILRGAKTR